jgi:hypothetical protein
VDAEERQWRSALLVVGMQSVSAANGAISLPTCERGVTIV